MTEAKKCSAKCEFFRCNQKALKFGSNIPYCRFADDICDDYLCKYSFCIRNRLLANGLCGLTIKRVTDNVDTLPEEVIKGFKLKGKLQHKLGEKEIF